MQFRLCKCCGKSKVAVGYNDICPICGWEDDEFQCEDPDLDGGANILSLNQYKKWYKEKVKKDPNYNWTSETIKDFREKNKSFKFPKGATPLDSKKHQNKQEKAE